MFKSLASRLTAMYMGVMCLVLLVAAVGITIAQTQAFISQASSVQQPARDDAEKLIRERLHSGASLADASAYAQANLHRTNLYLYAVDPTIPNSPVLYDGSGSGPHNFLATTIGFWHTAVHGVAPDSVRAIPLPEGIVYVNIWWDRLGNAIADAFRRAIPFALFALAITYVLARLIASYAISPTPGRVRMLQKLTSGDFTPLPTDKTIPSEILIVNEAHNAAAASMQKAAQERELASENIRSFISDASHELKTPLTIIMGYIDAVVQGLIVERSDEQRILNKALTECRRMRTTVDKLILLARLDRYVEAPGAFNAAALAQDIAESMKPLAPELHLDLVAEQTLAAGSVEELREAIVCVIDNAVKYAPGSPIDLRVSSSATMIIIEIADAGPGMSPLERAHVFERFHRGSHSNVEGSGLGLAIAKRAVERANGRISLTSELGRGTTVTMYLPWANPNGTISESGPV